MKTPNPVPRIDSFAFSCWMTNKTSAFHSCDPKVPHSSQTLYRKSVKFEKLLDTSTILEFWRIWIKGLSRYFVNLFSLKNVSWITVQTFYFASYIKTQVIQNIPEHSEILKKVLITVGNDWLPKKFIYVKWKTKLGTYTERHTYSNKI